MDRENMEPDFVFFEQLDNEFVSLISKYSEFSYKINIQIYDSCGNDIWNKKIPDSIGYYHLYYFHKIANNYYFFGDDPNLGWSPLAVKLSNKGDYIKLEDIGSLFTSYYGLIQNKNEFILVGNSKPKASSSNLDATIIKVDSNLKITNTKCFGNPESMEEFLTIKLIDSTFYCFYQTGKSIPDDSSYFDRQTFIYKFSQNLERIDSFKTELPLLEYFYPIYNNVTKEILFAGTYQNGKKLFSDLIITNWQGKLLHRIKNNDEENSNITSITPFRDGWLGIVGENLVFYSRDLKPYKTIRVVPPQTRAELRVNTYWNERVIAVYGKAKNYLDSPEDDGFYSPFMLMLDSSGTRFATQTSLPVKAPPMVLFPNPSTGVFQIRFEPIDDGQLKEVEIFDAKGSLVSRFKSYGSIQYELEGEPGIYFIRVFNTNNAWSKTFRLLKY